MESVPKVHEMKGSYRAFVRVGTVPGHDEEVAQKLMKFKDVLEVHFISGEYDLLAVVELSLHGRTIFTPVQEITQFIVQKIRKLDGIRTTSTMLPLRSLTKQEVWRRPLQLDMILSNMHTIAPRALNAR